MSVTGCCRMYKAKLLAAPAQLLRSDIRCIPSVKMQPAAGLALASELKLFHVQY